MAGCLSTHENFRIHEFSEVLPEGRLLIQKLALEIEKESS